MIMQHEVEHETEFKENDFVLQAVFANVLV